MWGRLAARRPPLLFCSPSSLQSGAYSCILFSQYKTNGGKSDALSFKAPVCAGHGCACRRVMVSCVRCRPLQRHPLHPRRHSRLFRAVHNLCGFRQLRRGTAGDRVSHKPLRASYAGGLAGGKAPCPTLYASGLDIWIRLFSETPHQAKARSISPRAFRFIRSRNPHCRRPLRWCR